MADDWLRVTEALKLAGLVDFSGIAPEVLERARKRGTAVHDAIEGFHFGIETTHDPEIIPYLDAYKAFLREHVESVVSVEEEVANAAYRYRGRLDLRAVIKGNPWVLDVKATAAVPQVAALQLAGYALCLDAPHRRGVLHLKPDGWTLHEFSDKSDVHDWLACVRVAHWRRRHLGARVEE